MELTFRTKLRLSLMRSACNNENGAALVVGLLFIVLLAMLGITAVVMTTTDMKIGGNYKTVTQAFYIADAGLEFARDQLRTNLEASITISQMLAARVGDDAYLSDSASANISNGTFPADDLPLIAQTSFGGGTYRVYLTNDGTDGVTSLTDTNNRVTITSIGQGPANSLSILQEVVQKLELPPMPGAVCLPGPNVIFDGSNSNASGISGETESAISLTSPAAEATVQTNLTDIGRIDNYTCEAGAGDACINDELDNFDDQLTTVAGIEELADAFRSEADTYLPGPGAYPLTAAQVGTTSDRKIVFVDSDAILGPVGGAGMLIVTGELTIQGNFNYNGVILCIGKGKLLRNGAGNGEILGAVFVAKTRDDYGNLLSVLGVPTFNLAGGGNSDIRFDASEVAKAGGTTFQDRSWQEM